VWRGGGTEFLTLIFFFTLKIINAMQNTIGGITELSRLGFSKTLVLVYVKLGFKNTELGLT
jgi:hypothetical protein